MTRCFQVDRVKILVTFIHGIHKQKEYCLSVAQIVTSPYQSRIDDGILIDRTSDMINVLKETVQNNDILL